MNLALSWTDECFLLVLLISAIVVVRSLRKKHNQRAMMSLLQRPIAVCSGIVLLIFLSIAIVDSIHFTTEKSEISTHSVLDQMISPLGEITEKTYSRPLALTLYSKTLVFVKGHARQEITRLNYPPARIKNDSDKRHIIDHTFWKATGVTALIVGLLFCIAMIMSRRYAINKQVVYSALITVSVCLWLMLVCYGLSRNFHIFGTGKIGQDIFYYAVKSIRTGMIIGLLTTLFMMPLALLLGISAGYFGGIIDDSIQYIYTTLSSIPGVLLITASVLSMQTYITNHPAQFKTLAQGADARLLALCFILGVTSWTSLCRLLRAETLKLREIDFVLAAKALGSRSFKIIVKHLLPNLMHIVIMTLVLDFSFLILAEAVLTYVGVGVSPMTISWGNMINSARLELARDPVVWWPVLAAFSFMFTLVLASNLFADAVRDAFDPHH